MRGKNLATALLAGVIALCFGAPPHFAQTSTWDKYGPPARYQSAGIYDFASDTLVIFGGQHTDTSLNYNDLWWANNVTKAACLPPCALQWTRPSGGLSHIPSARFGRTAVYDSVNLRMVVFGGAQGVETPAPCLNDVHVLQYLAGVGGTPAWLELSPTGGLPVARYSHTAVYDSTDNEMIVFSGNNCSTTYYNDVWVLKNANGLGGTPVWTQLSPSGPAPGVRAFSSAVYDPANDRMIVFGGSNGTPYGDLWVLTHAGGVSGNPAWVQLTPGGTTPSARSGQSAVYDATNNRMIVYGGSSASQTSLSNTWVLANANGLGGTPSWTLTASGGTDQQRSLQVALYDPAANKMVVFGGKIPKSVNGNPTDDHVWVLNDANGL
ncbi:MAG TPA: kelch repeat-containing protein [Terriglobales bacterium]